MISPILTQQFSTSFAFLLNMDAHNQYKPVIRRFRFPDGIPVSTIEEAEALVLAGAHKCVEETGKIYSVVLEGMDSRVVSAEKLGR